MLPSSSSQLARFGQINHYKKFWLLQTQLEKQEQSASTALSLGVTSNPNVKEGKPLISSSALTTNGDHLINSNIAAHGSCRGDIVTSSASSSRAGAFPYCSTEPAGSSKFYTGYTHTNNGSSRGTPALSLAVNCPTHGSVARPHPTNFLDQAWSPLTSAISSPLSEQVHLSCNSPNSESAQTCIPEQIKASPGPDECDSSEWSNGRGMKKGSVRDNASSSLSSSTISSSTKKPHEPSGLHFNDSSPVPPSSIAVLLSSSTSGHGCCTAPPRTCSLCGTTKTPLWRSGPDGPKSLCNACGIRVKKTKRLQAAAMEAAGGGGVEGVMKSSAVSPAAGAYKRLLAATTKAAGRSGAKTQKRKLSMEAAENQSDPIFQFRKKKKKAARGGRAPLNLGGLDSGICYRVFGDAPTNLAAAAAVAIDNSTSSKKVSTLFAQDVEEAAVLLMALSCGLVLA